MTLDWKDGALAEGLACYGRAEYFEAHEHWESVWVKSTGAEKSFLQALIQTTVALHHLQRGNIAGANSLLQRALTRIEACSPGFGGIEVALLRNDIGELLQILKNDAPTEPTQFPQVRLHRAKADS